jgi:hypothetical protein
VRLALAGHWHRNNIAVHDGFEMVTSGPVGYPLTTSGVRLVELRPDRVDHPVPCPNEPDVVRSAPAQARI